MREPCILLTGRQQSTLDVLTEELRRYGRDVAATHKRDEMREWLLAKPFDFLVVGGGHR